MTLPDTQTVIAISKPGGPGVLRAKKIAIELPGDRQILIKVAAAGVNRPDVFQRMGLYPPPVGAPEWPGLEVAGTIVATGAKVRRWKTGDRVCALLAGGGYAEYALADEPLCLPIPTGISLTEAAALPETCFTVWHNLYERAELKSGEWLLVHGGGSGIGTTAIQMASALGAKVIATAGTWEKCKECENLGAVKALNYHETDFTQVCKDLTGRGVNVVLDMVGGDYVQANIKACAPRGRIVSIAFLRGSKVEIDLMPVMLKQLVLTGSTLRSQSVSEKARIGAGVEKHVWPLIADDKLRPIIHQRFALSDATDAHRLLESNQHIGKLLLIP